VLGVLVGAWTFVMGFTGWYKDPVLLNMFWVVIVIQIVVLLWTLRQTTCAGAATATPFYQALFGFSGTVVTGVVVSAVAGAFVRKK
jgi:hypothetical protein